MANANYPYMSVNGEFFTREALDAAWAYLEKQAPLWQAGIGEPSPTDKIAYHVLKQITVGRVSPEGQG